MDSPADLDALFQSFERLRAYLEHRIEHKENTATAADLLPESTVWAQLGQKFQLSNFEQLILLLGLALELEPNFQALCARAQGSEHKPYSTLGLALAMLPNAHWSVLSPQCPLHYWRLLHAGEAISLTDAPLSLDRRILCYLLGQPAFDEYLADYIAPIALSYLSELPPSHDMIAEQVVEQWRRTADPVLPLIALCGEAAMAEAIAAAVCYRLGWQLMRLSSAIVPTAPQALQKLQRDWQREAILSNSVLLIDDDSDAIPPPEQRTAVRQFLNTLTTPVIVGGRDRLPLLRRRVVTFDIPPLSHSEQLSLWQHSLGEASRDLSAELPRLASQFQLTPPAIQMVSSQFSLHPSSTANHLWQLCCAQARPQLDNLAQRLNPQATWDDLVLPNRQRQVLTDIATHLQYQAQVYYAWGFAHKSDRGLSISALFYGDSGTGKTMAAEVLAQTCQLDLYRIDLSNVVSKYIGETEKNLRRIFDAAESGGVILLFDEADALFGKRTEVKDSHDRHANIEVSYLLQRLETYRGLAILTSNFKNNLDDAFLRRLRFMVSFPFPDAPTRSAIWHRAFPPQTPTQGLDFDKLSQLKIAGGNIRNIALNAAFIAAQAGQSVTMRHVRQAAERDYLKLEKLLTREELKGWE